VILYLSYLALALSPLHSLSLILYWIYFSSINLLKTFLKVTFNASSLNLHHSALMLII